MSLWLPLERIITSYEDTRHSMAASKTRKHTTTTLESCQSADQVVDSGKWLSFQRAASFYKCWPTMNYGKRNGLFDA